MSKRVIREETLFVNLTWREEASIMPGGVRKKNTRLRDKLKEITPQPQIL